MTTITMTEDDATTFAPGFFLDVGTEFADYLDYMFMYDGWSFFLDIYTMGLGGNDFIWTGTGDDTVYGGLGNDTLQGWSGNDHLYGDAGNDRLRGEMGHDWLEGGVGADTLLGDAGNDTLLGDHGRDLLEGGDGDDYLEGGWWDNAPDTIRGGIGNDTASGGGGNDILDGGDGDDILEGGDGFDRLIGGSGNDYLVADGGISNGGAGDDTLVNFGVSETMVGGAGNDHVHLSFVFDQTGTGYAHLSINGGGGRGDSLSMNDMFVWSGAVRNYSGRVDGMEYIQIGADTSIRNASGGGFDFWVSVDEEVAWLNFSFDSGLDLAFIRETVSLDDLWGGKG